MPRPHERAMKVVKYRTPKKLKTRYKRKKKGRPKCALCKSILHGKMKKKSRKYGGYLCSKCTRKTLKGKI